MHLSFDRGTLLLRDCAPPQIPTALTSFAWDPRVGAFRAPAHHYQRIVAALRAGQHRGRDLVACRTAPPIEITQPPLRTYQALALDCWDIASRRGLVVLPTGAGKTHVALAAMARVGVATLVLVPTLALLGQWIDRIREFHDGPIGVVGGGRHELQPITACTFESALRHADAWGDRFGLLVVDEAHHFAAGVRTEALEMCAAPARLGLTATPPHDAEGIARLHDLIGPVTCEWRTSDLTGRHLAALERVILRVDLSAQEREGYLGGHEPFALARRTFLRAHPGAPWAELVRALAQGPEGRSLLAGHRRAMAIVGGACAKLEAARRLLARHAEDRVLLFTADNEAAYRLSRELLVPAITCDIGPAERASVFGRFREGRVRAIVSSRVMNEGIDVPEARVAIVLGGRLGAREHVQRVGRILRPARGKTALLYEVIAADTFEDRQLVRRGHALAGRRAS
jgi:superfamily II DNA or RNA helicase